MVPGYGIEGTETIPSQYSHKISTRHRLHAGCQHSVGVGFGYGPITPTKLQVSSTQIFRNVKCFLCYILHFVPWSCVKRFFSLIICSQTTKEMCELLSDSYPFHDNSPYLTHWGRDKMAAISQTTFSNAFSWMKMFKFRLRFHWSLFPRVQLTIFQHWFR